MDSIRENESLEDMITTLQAELNADIDDEQNIVLVEGSDDIKFVNHILEDRVICYEAFAGKHGVQQLIECEVLQDNRIVGICDRDYEREIEEPERMFYYDTCCMETMILSSKECMDGILDIYYNGIIDKQHLLVHALRELAPLSVLRKENEMNGYGINFERARINNCLEKEDETVCVEQLFEMLRQNDRMLKTCRERAEQILDEELLEITNGHDICQFLGKVLKGRKGDLGEERFRNLLLSNYRKADFKGTRLYANLKIYQDFYQRRYVD